MTTEAHDESKSEKPLGLGLGEGLGPLPEAVHYWRTDVPGRAGPLLAPLFTADQTSAYALDHTRPLLAEIDRLRVLLERAAVDLVRADTGRSEIVAAERERCAKLCETWMNAAERESGPEAAGWLHQMAQHMRGLSA